MISSSLKHSWLLDMMGFKWFNIKHHLLVSDGTLYGPMHTKQGVKQYEEALTQIKASGGTIEFGGKVCTFYNVKDSGKRVWAAYWKECRSFYEYD